MSAPTAVKPLRTPTGRLAQGAIFVLGAAVLAATAGADRLPFYWTPFALGVTYLVAAAVDGPRGGYWATAVGLCGWGTAVLYMGRIHPPHVDPAGAYLVGVGLSVVVAAVLRSRGFLISEIGLGATVAAGGLILALTPRTAGTLDDATTYAIALGVVGVLNLLGAAYQLVRTRSAVSAG